jgi:hypothetical protein
VTRQQQRNAASISISKHAMYKAAALKFNPLI